MSGEDEDHSSDAAARSASARAWKLQRELIASREWQTLGRIDAFARSLRLLEHNAHELWRAVHYLTEDPRSMLLGEVRAKEERDRWLEEIGRLLHNMVAATKTVVDHSRKLNRDLYGKKKTAARLRTRNHHGSIQYARAVRSLASEPVVAFVQKLRNLFVHWQMPSIVYVEHLGGTSNPTRTIALSRKELLAWGEWTSAARAFLQESSEDVDIGEVADRYMTAIRSFYEWFAGQLEKVHATEYATVNAKLAEIARLRAPDVFASLRQEVANVEAGRISAYDAAAHLLTAEERLLLDGLRDDASSWVESALYHLAEHYGEIPQDIATRLQNAARAR